MTDSEKNLYVSNKFLTCMVDFGDFKKGENYWLEYVGDDTYVVRSEDLLINMKTVIKPYQLLYFIYIPYGDKGYTKRLVEWLSRCFYSVRTWGLLGNESNEQFCTREAILAFNELNGLLCSGKNMIDMSRCPKEDTIPWEWHSPDGKVFATTSGFHNPKGLYILAEIAENEYEGYYVTHGDNKILINKDGSTDPWESEKIGDTNCDNIMEQILRINEIRNRKSNEQYANVMGQIVKIQKHEN